MERFSNLSTVMFLPPLRAKPVSCRIYGQKYRIQDSGRAAGFNYSLNPDQEK
jgi:hypothetical protein